MRYYEAPGPLEADFPGEALKHVLVLALLALPLAAGSVPTTKPEEVELSSERLRRIDQMIQRHIDAGASPIWKRRASWTLDSKTW
jgi:hypothetical protein